jgi:hypothetical protein
MADAKLVLVGGEDTHDRGHGQLAVRIGDVTTPIGCEARWFQTVGGSSAYFMNQGETADHGFAAYLYRWKDRLMVRLVDSVMDPEYVDHKSRDFLQMPDGTWIEAGDVPLDDAVKPIDAIARLRNP